MDIDRINAHIQDELKRRRLSETTPVEAASWLDEAGLLPARPDRPGLPLRKLLRAGRIMGRRQESNHRWYIDKVAARSNAGSERPPWPILVPETTVHRGPEDLRSAFRPAVFRVLFVGESPPAGGTFFYTGNSNLFRYTLEGFDEAYGTTFSQPQTFLDAFVGLGCFLDDLCLVPVNGLANAERRAERAAGVAPLAARIATSGPLAVIPVSASIASHVTTAVKTSGHETLLLPALPFPARGHQGAYVEGLVAAINQLREQSILGAIGQG